MDTRISKKLLLEKLITEAEFEKLQSQKPVSVHWDLRTLLYLGIVLLTSAFGILIYKNIDTIGHAAVIIIIAILCAACFWHSFKNAQKFSSKKIIPSNTWGDYILLTGCLLLLTCLGYLQFEYKVFGIHWGLATFIPMVLLFIAAYYFDHQGVLSLAIINLAAWAGISATPLQMISDNDFGNASLIYSGIVLGVFLVALSFASVAKNIKAHFYFTYKNFGCNILLISLLAAMFYFENYYLIWFLALAVASYLLFKSSIKENSFYFLVITILYVYTGLSYVFIRLLFTGNSSDNSIYLAIIYFILSGIGLIWLFIHYNKILKIHAGI